MLKKSRTSPFWLFTLSAIVILIISQLVQDGMFMDGTIYTSVSKNLAEGRGTFWDPHFSSTALSSYHEQPPLYFGLLALCYKVFGTSMYVERLFCFICFAVTAFYIHKIWRKIYFVNTDIKNNSWLPILFWTIIPACFWAYTNLVAETVMTVFVTASVYFIYCALLSNENVLVNLLIGGVLIFLSSLTKGVQGMFPLGTVGLYWLVFRKPPFKRMISYTLILIAVPIIIYSFLLIIDPNVYLSFKKYYIGRYLPTFNNLMNTTGNRYDLLEQLFMQLLPIIALCCLILFFTKKYSVRAHRPKLHYQTITWLLLIGLSGTLPLLVTLEQRGFYLVTVLPFFAIALAMLVAPVITLLINKINPVTNGFNLFKILMAVLLITTISYSVTKVGDSKRDKDILSDVYKIGKIVPRGDTIFVPKLMLNDWSTRAYLIRYFNINIITTKRCKYFMIRRNLPGSLVPKGYQDYDIETKTVDFYILAK